MLNGGWYITMLNEKRQKTFATVPASADVKGSASKSFEKHLYQTMHIYKVEIEMVQLRQFASYHQERVALMIWAAKVGTNFSCL